MIPLPHVVVVVVVLAGIIEKQMMKWRWWARTRTSICVVEVGIKAMLKELPRSMRETIPIGMLYIDP